MSSEALTAYLAEVDPAAAPTLTALDDAIRRAHPGFDVAIKYRLVTYALDRDWRRWVCAIDANQSGVHLRFLWGVLLGDPLGVLRAGSSTLMTWDFEPGAAIDAAAVGRYVQEAVSQAGRYRAESAEITADVKAGRDPRRRGQGP